MATIKFNAADVRRLLRLHSTQDVEELIASKALTISAYTRTGRPLFDVDAVLRAAEIQIRARLD